jgi:hypothetical protein
VEMLGALLSEHIADGGMAVITSHQSVPLAGGRSLDLDGAARQPLRQALAAQGSLAAPLGGMS